MRNNEKNLKENIETFAIAFSQNGSIVWTIEGGENEFRRIMLEELGWIDPEEADWIINQIKIHEAETTEYAALRERIR